MSWQVESLMEQRQRFIEEVQSGQNTMSAICAAYGISRKTGYKWLKRYQSAGREGLVNQSRRPHHSPRRTLEEVEATIVALRQQHPTWGGRKLHAYLHRHGHSNVPAPSTITGILRRHDLLEASRRVRPYRRFEYEAPNQLWQMDFKGHFGVADGSRCHPLTVLDDHSRFLVALIPCAAETEELVRRHLTTLFQTYGLPERMLMDNGTPWGSGTRAPLTTLTAWLMRLGIRVLHGRPYHPQTQGKAERLHRTLLAELVRHHSFATLQDCHPAFAAWRDLYNQHRPHAALQDAVPADRYTPSPRPFPDTLPPLPYAPTDLLRKVDASGKISFRGHPFRISHALYGEYVALRPSPAPGVWDVWFAHCWLRHLSLPLPA
jgi:transposase InsO family protein